MQSQAAPLVGMGEVRIGWLTSTSEPKVCYLLPVLSDKTVPFPGYLVQISFAHHVFIVVVNFRQGLLSVIQDYVPLYDHTGSLC